MAVCIQGNFHYAPLPHVLVGRALKKPISLFLSLKATPLHTPPPRGQDVEKAHFAVLVAESDTFA